MDWAQPLIPALLLLPALVLLVLVHRASVHPMSPRRRRALTAVRAALVVLALMALAGPTLEKPTRREAVIFVLDHSRSQGEKGLHRAQRRARTLLRAHDADQRNSPVGFLSAGRQTRLVRKPTLKREPLQVDASLVEKDGAQTNLAAAVSLASGLFPPGMVRRVVLLTDGVQTRGDLLAAAREAAASGIIIDAVPVAGEQRRDVRVVRLRSSRARLHEGATVDLSADVESSLAGEGRVRLFENGIEVESRPLTLKVGDEKTVVFKRTPEERNLYNYRVRAEGFAGDAIPENDEGMTLVDVRGRPLILYVEGESEEARYLAEAMEAEGLRLHVRPVDALPEAPQDLAGYDAVIFSDVPAYKLTERNMSAIRDYVEKLGGGFVMIGGKNSFGVGGYYRTPIEDILPVKMVPPEVEERHVVALVLVIDRSGSMSGQKIEICKSAAVGTVELLRSKDYIGVVAFDSAARWIVPITRARSSSSIKAQISTINSGGGTNIHPGMSAAFDSLRGVQARVKHMIVLSDGHTSGGDYENLATRIRAAGITISTVAVGGNADTALLQRIARAGEGKFYLTYDPTSIPRIFTQDTMVHTGRLIREEAFQPRQVERHTMLRGWSVEGAPQLLGYVKTDPRSTSQVPLVTDMGDPLLAHWRFGLGKVTAFTSDCKSRWASLWITGWQEGYNQLWAQMLRETAREPQGRLMDIRLQEQGERAEIIVDVLEDPARYKNEALVEADVYFVPAGALGSSMKPVAHRTLRQVGPGRYRGEFRPDRAGVYLVRARSGADLVSAGLVYNVSGETASGRVNAELLKKTCALTGGTVLGAEDDSLSPAPRSQASMMDLRPVILKLMLLLFLADLALRRWENVLGLGEWLGDRWNWLRGLLPGKSGSAS